MDELQSRLNAVLAGLPPDARWSVQIADGVGVPLASSSPDLALSTASIGKVLVLIELAQRACAGSLNLASSVSRHSVEPVHDSGMWQHLTTDQLPLGDVAVLVGAVSDNWATNVLIDHLGLEQINLRSTTTETDLKLHDSVRNQRTVQHPENLSTASAAGLVRLFAGLVRARDREVTSAPAQQVLSWLTLNVDLSMVLSAFGLDPLAHAQDARAIRIASKTGTDEGVRADVGVVEADGKGVLYAMVVNWDVVDDGVDETRDRVLTVMRQVGQLIRSELITA